MTSSKENQLTPIQEGAEEAILSASKYLESQGIGSTVTLAEDCRPGT